MKYALLKQGFDFESNSGFIRFLRYVKLIYAEVKSKKREKIEKLLTFEPLTVTINQTIINDLKSQPALTKKNLQIIACDGSRKTEFIVGRLPYGNCVF